MAARGSKGPKRHKFGNNLLLNQWLRHLTLPAQIPAARSGRAPPVPLLADALPTGGALNEFFFDDPTSRDEESW